MPPPEKLRNSIANRLCRLGDQYKQQGETSYADILLSSRVRLDNWRKNDNRGKAFGGFATYRFSFDVTVLIARHYLKALPVDEERDFKNTLKSDLIENILPTDASLQNVFFEIEENATSIQQSAGAAPMPRLNEQQLKRIWGEPSNIRLFVSHLALKKTQAHSIKDALKPHGISAFVAHDSIEPHEDWQLEIESALESMHAMLALITADFFESAWTNQEIGYAISRGVPIISLACERQDPQGFIRNRQAIRGNLDAIQASKHDVLDVLRKRLHQHKVWTEMVITQFCESGSFASASSWFDELTKLDYISPADGVRLINAFNANGQIANCWNVADAPAFLDIIERATNQRFKVDPNTNGRPMIVANPS